MQDPRQKEKRAYHKDEPQLTTPRTAKQDLDKDDYIPEPFEPAPIEKVFALQKQEQDDRKKRDKRRRAKLQTHGFEGEQSGEALF